jgi:hypothetical protein
MPVFAQSGDDPFLDRPSACPADWDAHFVVASETVQLSLHLSCFRVQFDAAVFAVVVIGMVDFPLELDVTFLYYSVALVTDVFPKSCCFLLCIALAAQSSSSISEETNVGEFDTAEFASEALGVPTVVHCLDNTPNYELPTFSAAWGEENVKVVFAVFPSFKFVEYTIGERAETLGANKALLMPNLPSRVDDLFVDFKPFRTSETQDVP